MADADDGTPGTDIAIAMVALGPNAKISGTAIQKEWGAKWPGKTVPTAPEKKESTLAFRAGKLDIIYGLMPAPIPKSDLKELCATSWLWPNAAADLTPHKRHVIVTASGEADEIERMKRLTQATYALVATCGDALGVYWCTAGQLIPPKMFCDFATEFLPDRMPLHVWVNVTVGKGDNGKIQGFTRGMASLGHLELETRDSSEPPNELQNRLFGLAEYLLENGPVINDGDTFGESARERIKATFGRSSFGNEGQVMRLAYTGNDSSESGTRMTTYGIIHSIATLIATIGIGFTLYTTQPQLLQGSILRHVVLVPASLIAGFVLLIVSDNFMRSTFGLHSFTGPELTAEREKKKKTKKRRK